VMEYLADRRRQGKTKLRDKIAALRGHLVQSLRSQFARGSSAVSSTSTRGWPPTPASCAASGRNFKKPNPGWKA
jgi:hypothetical protein